MALSGAHVDRCVCHDVTFAQLLEIAEQTGADLEPLAKYTGCTTGCGLCKPYIAKAIELNTPILTTEQMRDA